jgi:hypothetical protein
MLSLRRNIVLSLAVLVLATAAPAFAQPAQGKCSTDRAHEFDFWIGEWEVFAGETKAGVNSIQPILDGCVLQETWTGAQGSAGSSFNFYNPQTSKWHQLWVWRAGIILDMSGDYKDGKMILEGESKNQQGAMVMHRVTWYDNEDGTVRQHWQQSSDKGKTWTTAFDGMYKKKS